MPHPNARGEQAASRASLCHLRVRRLDAGAGHARISAAIMRRRTHGARMHAAAAGAHGPSAEGEVQRLGVPGAARGDAHHAAAAV
mmetsp:Transcript_59501/g.136464  ORF Transcript_59501/g.136464 Transcript_59501/m.136464 type:complete len:85 (+) Transcript_59501:1509-1763(+)